MSRASRRGWFVAGFVSLAFVAGAAACTKGGDVGSVEEPDAATSAEEAGGLDASLLGDTSTFTLDALPTTFPDSTVDEASADATIPPPVAEASPGCEKPSANDPCGLDPQCGCSALETCDVDGGGTLCVTAGTAAAGHGCTTTASCAPGLTCFNGACRPYCTNRGDAGCEKLPEGGTCVAVTGDDGGPLPNYDVCTFKCQLQDPKACGPTGDLLSGCVSDNAGGTDCEGVGLANVGDDCTYLNDCLPGLVCLGQCAAWCRVGHSPSDCGDGEACHALDPTVTANGVEYGYCP